MCAGPPYLHYRRLAHEAAAHEHLGVGIARAEYVYTEQSYVGSASECSGGALTCAVKGLTADDLDVHVSRAQAKLYTDYAVELAEH